MPLVRFEVRNEYGLGQGELYREGNREEDSKAVLDGVAVAGLVGILRQLGDLAEFAAEVFHGLQERVISTASRSHKLMVRVQSIEAALPPLEKAVLAQTSHIHFAYTPGSEWHPCIQNEQNHFIYNDLPQFIMDSYEECRDPPRLHLLDKFDTGGPGSCLKRYSDPSYFRRVSGNVTEPDAEKLPKDKRPKKSKKKRSSQRNGDVAHYALMSNHSGRMQFTTPTGNGQTSPSHTTSTIDTTLKSDAGDQSNSFDSRTGSGYIECVFHLNSSVQAEEEEPKEFSSSSMQQNDFPDSVFPDRQPAIADNNFNHTSSPEQIAASISSCVTWDEKEEIVEPSGQHYDEDEISEVLAAEPDLDTHARSTVNVKNPNLLNIVLNDANSPKSSSSRSQLDEFESEPDDFMDALNTIESESENEIDCQTKCEVEQFSSSVNKEVEETMHEVTSHISDHHPSECDVEQFSSSVNKEVETMHEVPSHISDHHSSEYESCTLSVISSNEKSPCELPSLVSSKSFACEQESHVSGNSSKLDSSPGIECSTSANVLENSKVESVSDPPSSVSATSISNSQGPLSDKTISSSNMSRESQDDFSGVHSTTFWTNGGLLGLEPSKPPDFAVSNAKSPDYVTRSEDETGMPPNHTSMPINGGKPGRLIKDAGSIERAPGSKGSTSWHDDQDTQVEKSGDFHQGNRISHGYEDGQNITSAVTPGNVLPQDSYSKVSPIESGQENDENLYQRLGFGHRLLVNGLSRKVSLVHDGEREPNRLLRSSALEQQSWHNEVTYQATPEKAYNKQLGHKYSIDSIISSPPLEHMKISFHPIDGFEDSKLKLKFPDGNHGNESIRDMFPSFQLIPETVSPLCNGGSDSDDDTFCRSSPYMSDDHLSHHSESDSEQWDSDGSPESKDHEPFDALQRISPVESFSSSLQAGEAGNNQCAYTENGAEPSLSASSLDLPCFDAMNSVVYGEKKDNLHERNQQELEYRKDSTPLPPPLPPVQWRVSKPHSDISEGKLHAISEGDEHGFDLKLLESTVPQQPKPSPADDQKMNEDVIAFKPKSKEQGQQKLNCHKEANQYANGMDTDEKEDFLHQIRAKSFTLRRAAKAKPTLSSGPTVNNKVSAILEKASVIRQAVASDDGEDDDTWSDA
ncbi:PROTEIN SCAR1 [Salix koriyanagi]|uniref:Protein SCAR n=1 Tax=Salix koriyanagi TaxID=2511006 RepID=A0A9Q0ZKZ7_9ROSI|nr:PROTEIN SCAR1 [Salix koriyanagi]